MVTVYIRAAWTGHGVVFFHVLDVNKKLKVIVTIPILSKSGEGGGGEVVGDCNDVEFVHIRIKKNA